MKFFTKFSTPGKKSFSQIGETSRTKQSERDNVDINHIMERFNRTGKLPITQTSPARYGDARTVDYAQALQIIKDAENAFNELPAKIRKEFGDSAQNYISAVEDTSEANVKKLLDLGIIIQREETEKDLLTKLVKNTKPEKPAKKES